MVQGGASAYLYERPEESRTSQIPSGAAVTIPEYGTGALGYRSPISDSFTPGQPDALFGTTGYLLVSVNVAAAQPGDERRADQRAADPARAEPVARPGRRDAAAPQRPGAVPGSRPPADRGRSLGPGVGLQRQPQPPRRRPLQPVPADAVPAVRLRERDRTGIHLHLLRTGNRELRRAGPQLDEPAQAAAGRGRSRDPRPQIGDPVRVQRGHDDGHGLRRRAVLLDAGDRPGRQRRAALRHRPAQREPFHAEFRGPDSARPGAAAPAPAPAPAPIAPPPAPPTVAGAAGASRRSSRRCRRRAAVYAALSASGPSAVPAIPPPPAAAFGQPIPPGGATVRVFEEKREEEEATEQSQAFAAYRAEDYRGLPIGARAYAAGGGSGARLIGPVPAARRGARGRRRSLDRARSSSPQPPHGDRAGARDRAHPTFQHRRQRRRI